MASGGTVNADTATRPQAGPAESGKLCTEAQWAQAAAADTIQPAAVQVQVCSVEFKDAASNLPVGNVASGGTVDADTATRTQAAPVHIVILLSSLCTNVI